MLTADEVVKILEVSRRTLTYWAKNGRLVPVRKGYYINDRREDIAREKKKMFNQL